MTYSDPNKVLAKAPGPAPWYIRASPPELDGVVWQDTSERSDIGAMMLKKVDGSIIALVGMYCYVLAIDRDRFLIWHQTYDSSNGKHRERLTFVLGSIRQLETLADAPKLLNRMKENDVSLVLNDEGVVTFDLPTNLAPGIHEIAFPPAIKFTDELLLWGHNTIPNFQPHFGKNSDLCLFILQPKSNTLEIVPQDWFNNSDTLDFGYQWATRVARDPGSERIYGDGTTSRVRVG